MTEGKPNLLWPGANDRVVVEEMLRDHQSEQWYECNEFVKKRVQAQAKNIPRDRWDDIAQEVMVRIEKHLPAFRHSCSLATWIVGITRNCIIDDHRKLVVASQLFVLSPSYDEGEHENEALDAQTSQTVEDECIIHDDLTRALLALEEYVVGHANEVRNKRILDIVIFEGRSLEEAARAAGCSAPVAGYIVRSAQSYARKKLKD